MAITYKRAGVDITKGSKLVDIIKPLARTTFRPGVLQDIGSFGALYRLNTSKYQNPVLVSSTDGVGTKLKIAFMLNRHKTVGIDLVAMCVNDILASGARPLFFLDYFASGKLTTKTAADVISGIVEGCKMAGCSLIGGETAEMPGFYGRGEYDLSGFTVGVVEKKDIISGMNIRSGDILLGLPSSGLHSNGYSLAREVFFRMKNYRPNTYMRVLGTTLGEELLKPTRIYVQSVLKVLRRNTLQGIAHITGGGLTENLPRILPGREDLRCVIERDSWPVHEIFRLIQSTGSISEAEMYRTFNMGIGLVLVVRSRDVHKLMKSLRRSHEEVFPIGRIEKGKGGVKYV